MSSESAALGEEIGYASWYGDPYHGRRAANGEIYDKHKLTAAHRTLPFDTRVKVTNLENNKTVDVRITDRGPFVKGRIIDVSLAAAQKLEMVGAGTALVKLEVLAAPEAGHAPPQPEHPAEAPAEPDGGDHVPVAQYAVQVAALRDRAAAQELRDKLAQRYGAVFIESYNSAEGTFYRVRVGPEPSIDAAREFAARLESEHFETFIVRLDANSN